MAELIEKDDFKEMESCLQKVSKKLSVGDNANEYIDSYTEIRLTFCKALQNEDPIFKTYKKIQLMGSSYERTRIRQADEFDMNICLKLPFDHSKVILKNGPKGGFVTIQIPGELEKLKKSPQWSNYKAIDKWMENDDFIYQNKLITWMQSICTKADNTLKISFNPVWLKYDIIIRTSGPSIGLWITHRQKGIQFSVDFVPVLVFKYPIWPNNVNKKYATQFSTDEWYAVPKRDVSQSSGIGEKLWRISFPQQECDMLKSNEHLRIAQRLIKQLRENREITFLKSYFIKTVFMMTVEKKKNDKTFWHNSISYLFMYMLTTLQECVDAECIPFFWDHSYNVLSVLTPNQISHCNNSLLGSIRYIKGNFKDEKKILQLLMPPDTLRLDASYLSTLKDFDSVVREVISASNGLEEKEKDKSMCVIL